MKATLSQIALQNPVLMRVHLSPVSGDDVRDFVPVLYSCYPHTDDDGTPEIRGFLTHNGEQELIIFTHPEAMKNPTLEGHSDFIYLDMVTAWWYAFDMEMECDNPLLEGGAY